MISFARLLLLSLIAALAGCGSTPMALKSQAEAGQLRPLQRVLIVSNGDLFPDATRQSFFLPSAEGIKQMFVENGITAWTMELKTPGLNPMDQIAGYAKALDAQHVLVFAAARVTSLGPRNSAMEYKQQQRLIANYDLNFSIIDMSTRRTVWKGEMHSGSDYSGTDQEIRQIKAKLQEHLSQARLMKPAQNPDKTKG